MRLLIIFCVFCCICTMTYSAPTDTSSTDVFKMVKDKLIIVQCDDAVGSGFIMEMEEGNKYFLTNKHVVQGQKRVAAFLLNGKELKLGSFEMATNRDLVRFALPKNTPSLIAKPEEPNVGEDVYIFGNSDGANVATDLTGKINGVGPDTIEVDAQFVSGNSGSAVLNANGEVVGVATFATSESGPQDWVKQNTRFANVRRFAVRMRGVQWKQMKYSAFYKKCVAEEKKAKKELGVYPQCEARFLAPKLVLQKRGSYLCATANIEMSLYGSAKDDIKMPIVRLCLLINKGSRYVVQTFIFTEPQSEGVQNSQEFSFSIQHSLKASPPVYTYGEAAKGGWSIGNNRLVYYLEALSFFQGLMPRNMRKKGIKYWCGPAINVGIVDGTIECIRLECWQNGALAGVYSSKNPVQLNSKKLPVDWFVIGRYPDKFLYNTTGKDIGSGYYYY